jgi:hypothetical protein
MTERHPMLPPAADSTDSIISFPAIKHRPDETAPGDSPKAGRDDLQFKTLAEAEEFLQSQGFWVVPNTCNWTNAQGDDAGVYSIDGYWGEVKGWRVEINRRVAETNGGGRLSRRLMLAGLAVLPAAVTGIPASVCAAAEPDPIFAAIERHKQAADVWDAAVQVWGNADGPAPVPIECALCDARDSLDDAGVDLINTAPTTLHGIARALNYIRQHMVKEDGVYMPSGLGLKGDDDPEVVGWVDAFLDTIGDAATELGKAVRS